MTWAALFNRRAANASGSFADALDLILWEALGGGSAWPEHDLFAEIP